MRTESSLIYPHEQNCRRTTPGTWKQFLSKQREESKHPVTKKHVYTSSIQQQNASV